MQLQRDSLTSHSDTLKIKFSNWWEFISLFLKRKQEKGVLLVNIYMYEK